MGFNKNGPLGIYGGSNENNSKIFISGAKERPDDFTKDDSTWSLSVDKDKNFHIEKTTGTRKPPLTIKPDGSLTVSDNLDVSGVAKLGKNLTVEGAATLKSDLTVNGKTTINGGLELKGQLEPYYDSGWFPVEINKSYEKENTLCALPSLVQMFFSPNPIKSPQYIVGMINRDNHNGYNVEMTSKEFIIVTGKAHVCVSQKNQWKKGYYRFLAWKLIRGD